MENIQQEPWVSMFKNNQIASNWMSLEGRSGFQLDAGDVQAEKEKWRSSLITYVIGDCPGYNTMNKYITQNWSIVAEPEIFLHEEEYYIVKFQQKSDMDTILSTGPFSINNRPIVLKPWSANFDFSKEFLAEIPLRVKFPNLPLNCWRLGSLSRITSALGTPLLADECTTKQTRIS